MAEVSLIDASGSRCSATTPRRIQYI
jgi:hypothetical protein